VAQAVARGARSRTHHAALPSQRHAVPNILLLWGEAVAKVYAAPIWMTYKQAQELGGQVRKGEHGSHVV
jgi:antirestriction protein ArdC